MRCPYLIEVKAIAKHGEELDASIILGLLPNTRHVTVKDNELHAAEIQCIKSVFSHEVLTIQNL